MKEMPDALKILLHEREKFSPSIPLELVEAIYRIEERVQFDEERKDAPQKIRQALKMVLDKEFLEGSSDGNAF